MAAYISFQPSDFFNTKLYTGTGASLAITGVGFQPDFVWAKNRDATDNHTLFDSPRGVTEYIGSNTTTVETTGADSLNSFDSDGFTLGTWGDINGSGEDYVSWNWKAGTTSGLSGGTITPSAYSFNTTSGFGIYAYTGTGANATIPHGLGVAPHLVIVKHLSGASDWEVGSSSYTSWAYHQGLNLTNAESSSATCWNSTAPTSTVFSVGTNGAINGSGQTFVAYVFANVKGYSKFGSYTGNGSVDGPFIYTGFRPAYIMIKSTSGAGAWAIFDNKRSEYNVVDKQLAANTTEVDQTSDVLDILSNGFKIRATSNMVNGSGWEYIYSAFAEFPFVSSNSKAGTAR